MRSSRNDQVEAPSGDATATAGARGRTAAIGGAVAVLLVGGAIWAGAAGARSWGAESSGGSAAAPVVRATTAAPTAADPYSMASTICGASQADMERWVTVAQSALPDAEAFANFLGHEAGVVDHTCPGVRPAFDAATWAAASIRLAPSN